MRKDNQLGAELLRQEGLRAGELSDKEREEVYAMLEMQRARTARMKRATVASWAGSAVLLLVGGVAAALHPNGQWAPIGLAIGKALFFIAPLLTIGYMLNQRACAMTEIRVRLADIEAAIRELGKQKG